MWASSPSARGTDDHVSLFFPVTFAALTSHFYPSHKNCHDQIFHIFFSQFLSCAGNHSITQFRVIGSRKKHFLLFFEKIIKTVRLSVNLAFVTHNNGEIFRWSRFAPRTDFCELPHWVVAIDIYQFSKKKQLSVFKKRENFTNLPKKIIAI